MSSAPTLAVVTPVTVSTTSESVLAQVLVPQFTDPGPAIYVGTTFRITALCSFTVGGTAGTITVTARIGGTAGGVGGSSLGTAVTGTLTLSTSGALVIEGYVTLTSPGNWSGGVKMTGTGTGATVIGAGVATVALSSALPQFFTVTTTLSSATSSLTMNSAIIEQVV